MKKVLSSLGILSIAALLTAAASSMLAPAELEAGNCFCGPTQQTSIQHTDDVTCAAATGRLRDQLEASTGCDDFCLSQLVITMACTPNPGGGYWIGGYLRYQCKDCIDIPEM